MNKNSKVIICPIINNKTFLLLYSLLVILTLTNIAAKYSVRNAVRIYRFVPNFIYLYG